jgi:hypothetical protein
MDQSSFQESQLNSMIAINSSNEKRVGRDSFGLIVNNLNREQAVLIKPQTQEKFILEN